MCSVILLRKSVKVFGIYSVIYLWEIKNNYDTSVWVRAFSEWRVSNMRTNERIRQSSCKRRTMKLVTIQKTQENMILALALNKCRKRKNDKTSK
jgi:hypothetical protein